MIDVPDWIDDVLLAQEPDWPHRCASLLFLLRRYVDRGTPAIRDAVEAGLADALERFTTASDALDRCEWLYLFAEASGVSPDEQLAETVNLNLAAAVEGLERHVGSTYEPGDGLIGQPPLDQLRAAGALLSAFELTGRLPYSMLAEELAQRLYREGWIREQGRFDGDFAFNCLAARMCCRLAGLHRDPDYTAAAVVAETIPYASEAAATFAWLERVAREHEAHASLYGVALLDWFAFASHPN